MVQPLPQRGSGRDGQSDQHDQPHPEAGCLALHHSQSHHPDWRTFGGFAGATPGYVQADRIVACNRGAERDRQRVAALGPAFAIFNPLVIANLALRLEHRGTRRIDQFQIDI